MKKRLLLFLLALTMCLSLSVFSFATDNDELGQEAVDALTTSELRSAENAAIRYLEKLSRTTLLFNDIDLTEGTVLSYNIAPTGLSNSDVQLMNYVVEKSTFLKYRRSLEGLYRTKYNATYAVENTNIVGNRATIKVFEHIDFQYVDCDFMSAMSNLYTVNLIKANDTWFIAGVEGGDCYAVSESLTFNYATEINELHQERSSTERDQGTLLFSHNATYSTNYRPYIGTNAAAYAETYTDNTGTSSPTMYNSNFKFFSGADCQNFASQCVWAGFGGSNIASAISAHDVPMDAIGSNSNSMWYGAAAGTSDTAKTPSWTACSYFRDYISGNPSSTTGIVADIYESTGDFGNVASTPSALLGAVLHVTNPGYSSLGHAVVITRATSLNRSDVFFSGHTNNRLDCKLSDMYGSTNVCIILPRSFCNTAGNYYVYPTLYKPQPVGSTVPLKASCNRVYYELYTVITTPNGTTSGFTYYNTSSYNKSYSLSTAGLYKITIYARETSSTSDSNRQVVSYTIRVV